TGATRMRVTCLSACLLLTAAMVPARADYPERSVRIVVSVAAGGGIDVMARMLAQKLGERWGQQFVVENRAGAAGGSGAQARIVSPADGYTPPFPPRNPALAR